MNHAWMDVFGAGAAVVGEALWRASVQGTVALLLVWVLCRALPRIPVLARCWLWRIAYVKLLLALFWVTPIDLPLLPAVPAPAAVNSERERPAPALETAAWQPERVIETSAAAHGVQPAAGAQPPPAARPWPLALLLALGMWLVGAAWCAGRLVVTGHAAGALLGTAEPVQNPRLLRRWWELCSRAEVCQVPHLMASPAATTPLLLDALRPTVVLPPDLAREGEVERVAPMLAHELAHVQRADLLWGWLAAAVHTVFFFHPLVWVANREWRLAQEIACDEAAVRLTQTDPSAYAGLLVELAVQVGARPQPGLAILNTDEGTRSLQRRLIAMNDFRPVSHRRLLLAGGLAGALALLVLVPYRVIAQATPPDPPEPPVVEVRPAPPAAPAEPKPEQPAPPKPEEPVAPPPPAAPERPVRPERPDSRSERTKEALRRERDALRELETTRPEIKRHLEEARRRVEEELRNLERRRPEVEQHLARARAQLQEELKRIDERNAESPEEKAQLEARRQAVREALEEVQKQRPEVERALQEARRELEQAKRELDRQVEQELPRLTEEQQRAVGEVLKQLPQILEQSLGAARGQIREQLRKAPPEKREEIRRKLEQLPGEVERGLAEARRALGRKLPGLSEDQRKQIEDALRQVQERLRTLPEELKRELDRAEPPAAPKPEEPK